MGIKVEREVKFSMSSWKQGETMLMNARGEALGPRCFELNSLFDFPTGTLRKRGEALRLRRVQDRAWLTFKGPAQGVEGMKHRNEYETSLDDADAVERILEAIGMEEQFRYEKYRQTYRLRDIEACLDETPIGFFIELEGEADGIGEAIRDLKLSMDRALSLDYPTLYANHRSRFPAAPRFMVFPEDRQPR
ncbi:MAG: class IV adenylate cyclase [Vicinamibacteria bacterium]